MKMKKLPAMIAAVVMIMMLPPSAFASYEVESIAAIDDAEEMAAIPFRSIGDGTTYNVLVENGRAIPSEAEAGSTVTVIADPPEYGQFFRAWETRDEVKFADAAASKTTFVMPGDPVNVIATYGDILIDPIDDRPYTGQPITPEVRVFLEGVDVKLIKDTDYTVSYRDNVNAGKAAAVVTLKGVWAGTGEVEFEILPIPIDGAVVEADDQEYDGTEHEPEPKVKWNGTTITKDNYTLTYADNVHAGTASVIVTGKGNFTEDSKASGTFEITKRPVTVTADSDTKIYDGTPLTAGYSSSGLAEGDTVSEAKVEGSQNDAGSSPNTVSGARIENAAGEDVTDDYEISYKDGTLTVEPADAVITVYDAEKVVGEPDHEFTGSVEGLVAEGDLGEITFIRTGDDEEPGTYEGVLTASYTDNPNYEVTVENGDFTIIAKYKVTFVDDDGTVLKDTVEYVAGTPADEIEKPSDPVKPADKTYTYTFAGWEPAISDVTEDVTYRATYNKKKKNDPNNNNGTPTDATKTGDRSRPGLWIAIIIAAAAIIGLLAFKKRKP